MVESRRWQAAIGRMLALVATCAAGLLTIVGCGGGDVHGTITVQPSVDPPPTPTVRVIPGRLTVQGGTPATFTATVSNATGEVTYRWSRSLDDGRSFDVIPGATQSSYTIASATLADDALYAVRVGISGAAYDGWPIARLAVSPLPGISFRDPDFELADWMVSSLAGVQPSALVLTVERVSEGGHPGSYLNMVFVLPLQPSDLQYPSVAFAKTSALYDPRTQGAAYVIDYSEDCLMPRHDFYTSNSTSLLLEQAGRAYEGGRTTCQSGAWEAAARAALRAEDFKLVEGPACGDGESCPDFSSSGPPMRFGFRRYTDPSPIGTPITHAIDNWSVTVWRR